MKLCNLKQNDTIVKIVNKNSDWYGLYGIVEYINHECAYVFCISKPTYHYKITQDNINDIKIMDLSHC
ncbi:hypothetical protein [Clostridium botulinum]|uniref:Uncharacterized protein n=1 Tax=Clostridium botulinum TaxID=1491 RepID=A0A9Q1UX53_CLOBO|nr:hypothetical protein [Clostridium botulinum]KEH96887.1 hypothetical protein Z953_13575 [Clostridium botulinum D str. 16868]KLU74655.1 hypothetical protein CBC3_13240 [Clostridium botulinum V891]KOA75834.1 hypothetical protein ADU77_10535 [Clostridium botulinum]KOA78199.1 hypothetical protein ADU78_01975 [Clostridium botulinum]KOA84244.1 hypothetical protein ADU74_11500 [Clostridium botulinum]